MNDIKAIVKTFYTDCLTVNNRTDVAKVMGNLLADDFQSINASETKGKGVIIGQIQFFWKLIPNLKWEPQEILQDGNKVVVRSTFSGSPKGDFMGVMTDGKKSFNSVSIDIHTVENGKIKSVFHLEDWPTVMAQLKS
ncbi:MAG: ester cyclase [Bacteroidota bacterium]|nr:ester cyclase [Bacteroidota bacterium]